MGSLATLTKDGSFVQQGDEAAQDPVAPGDTKDDQLAAFEGLKGKAEESLQRMRDEEVKKQNEHSINIASLEQAVALAENKLDDAQKEKARISEEKAKASDEHAETSAAKAADEESLKSATAECTEAAASWDTRQKEAKAEMSAI